MLGLPALALRCRPALPGVGIPRSTFYARRHSGAQRAAQAHRKRRPGPRPRLSDEQLHQEIRAVIEGSAFTGEGHRKVWAKLRQLQGVYTSLPQAGPAGDARARALMLFDHQKGFYAAMDNVTRAIPQVG
ncbi:hypothetical protein LRD18_12625 [Halorhodospira halochloris]|uniref:hypothetical protein n=1 Tax=Halorhodospira halochloris TaxID=1052 RepID=UPI001EE86675|nr:hypothetical protein [Halorhodospira halochloris]MCG5531681.1 hypothetical protein [Halorhodospira halochloris]